MLSKIEFFNNHRPDECYGPHANVRIEGLVKCLDGGVSNLRPISGGTLGFCLMGQIDGVASFLKTHTVPGGRRALEKEFDILNYLYGSSINVKRFEVDDGDLTRLWLVMDEMTYPDVAFDARQALAISADFTRKLRYFEDLRHVEPDVDFAWFLRKGRAALGNLASHELIGDAVRRRGASIGSKPALCHGDFGPKNLMCHGVKPVAIDWEDAFWGLDGFDYLYWLTFFENRKYYSRNMFERTSWSRSVEIGIMAVILIIKSDISFRAGRHTADTLTFDQRISEILDFE
jgi:hypothetical protein